MNSILGSILVVIGMYILLWGKSNEKQGQTAEEDADCNTVPRSYLSQINQSCP